MRRYVVFTDVSEDVVQDRLILTREDTVEGWIGIHTSKEITDGEQGFYMSIDSAWEAFVNKDYEAATRNYKCIV